MKSVKLATLTTMSVINHDNGNSAYGVCFEPNHTRVWLSFDDVKKLYFHAALNEKQKLTETL